GGLVGDGQRRAHDVCRRAVAGAREGEIAQIAHRRRERRPCAPTIACLEVVRGGRWLAGEWLAEWASAQALRSGWQRITAGARTWRASRYHQRRAIEPHLANLQLLAV